MMDKSGITALLGTDAYYANPFEAVGLSEKR
jgi:hypothetical protein